MNSPVIHRPVPGHDDLYAGMDGSLVHGVKGELKQNVGTKGYWTVKLPGSQSPVESHRLVAAAFLGPRPKGIETRHGEGGKLDNSVGNLCYGTHRDNMQDAMRDGRHGGVFHGSKTKCPRGHEYTPENTYVHTIGGYTRRQCRECRAKEILRQNVLRKKRRAEKRVANKEG